MWLSRQKAPAVQEAAGGEMGTVADPETSQVVTQTQSVALPVLGPGGFCWRPQAGQRVLVSDGAVVAGETVCPVALQPGECCLFAPGCSIHLTALGEIRIQGRVLVNGTEL